MKRLRSIPLRLATRALLVVAIVWNVAAASTFGDAFTRPLDVCVAVFCTFVLAFTWGREQMLASWRRSIEWMPKEIAWHDDDDGVRHAFVTQHNGSVVTLALPPEITSADAALAFIYEALLALRDER